MAAIPVPFIANLRARTWMLSRDAHERSWSKRGRPDRQRILEDHGYCCQFCGLISRHGMDIHHKNGDHSDFEDANLCPICPLCHQSFHPGFSGCAREAAIIIAPNISQWTLNRLVLSLYVAEESGEALARPAFELLNSLGHLRQQTKELLGSDNPYDLSKALLDLNAKARDAALPHLAALRLLPLPRIHRQGQNQFQKILNAYVGLSGGAFAHMPVNSWASLAQKERVHVV